jgi:23S rRNA (cytidine1920-2'-O)/16S rRNA (cytidine1409-2'-O)-methyltransferase
MAAKKERLDARLVREGLFPTREKAQRAILAGLVRVAGQRVTKAGTPISEDAAVEVERPALDYVSRGALKLERALAVFGVDPARRHVMDVGASTGGFTDLLLQRGAAGVYAIDVGYGQLAWKLRQDPRVHVLERTNVRHLEPAGLGAAPGTEPDLAVIDVSFISLGKILPAVHQLLAPPRDLITLIKPQFEAGKESVGKGGVVRDPAVHERVLREVTAAAATQGWHAWGLTYSPIKGPEGNIEFLGYWRQEPAPHAVTAAEAVVAEAHAALKAEGK